MAGCLQQLICCCFLTPYFIVMNTQSNISAANLRGTINALLFSVTLLVAPVVHAQSRASIAGIDHIGVNVPDMKQAVQFFSDVLGFTPVTQIGPIPLDSTWKRINHMQQGTGPVTIKMVRAGTGANIELFEYAGNKGNAQQPGGDDAGATHIAFYTYDIKSAVAYLKTRNVTVLGEPFLTPVGDTKGESWVYFLTPWGAKLELVSYPEGKEYEKKNPVTLLWSPKSVTGKINNHKKETAMSATDITKLVEQHIAIWNAQDTVKRNTLLAETYASDIEMVDRHFTAVGPEQISTFIKGLHDKNPGFQFSHAKPIDTHSNIARLFWQFGSAEKPAVVTGMDLFVVENGKISKLYVFVDEVK